MTFNVLAMSATCSLVSSLYVCSLVTLLLQIKLNMEGAGRFDIIVEVMVNSLPDLIRHILVDTIEEPLKYKIQQLLNKIEPHQILEKTLPELDNLGL